MRKVTLMITDQKFMN